MKAIRVLLICLAIVCCFSCCDMQHSPNDDVSTDESTTDLAKDPVDWAALRYPWPGGLQECTGFRIPAEELSIRDFFDVVPNVTTFQELFDRVGLPHGFLPTSFLWQYYLTKEGWTVRIALGKHDGQNETIDGDASKDGERIPLEDIKTIVPDTQYELPDDVTYMWFSYTGPRIPSQELSISDFPRISSGDDAMQQLFNIVGLPHGETKENNTPYYVYITRELYTVWVDVYGNISVKGEDGSLTALSDFVP